MFEAPSWEERYAGDQSVWSGNPNAQLVAEASGLAPGTALDVGCGEGGDVTRRLAEAVAPGGSLLVVGHAPSATFTHLSESHRSAMLLAEDLLPALPDDFEPVVVEQRPRTMVRDGETVDVHDSTLLARRRA